MTTAKIKAADALRAAIREAARDIPQTDIATMLGITPQYVSDMMTGRRRWGPDRLDLLAAKLGVRDTAKWHRLGAAAEGWRTS